MSSTTTGFSSGGRLAGIIIAVVFLFVVVVVGPIGMCRDGGWWKKGGGGKPLHPVCGERGSFATELRSSNAPPRFPDRVHISNDDTFDMGPEMEAPPVYRELGRPPMYEEASWDAPPSHESVVQEQVYMRNHG